MGASHPEDQARAQRRAQKHRPRRRGFRATTPAQRHRSARGRRYTRKLRADLRHTDRRLQNALVALERITKERKRLTAAKDTASAALQYDAHRLAERQREVEDE